jgi:hypothetical protein
MPRSTDEVTQHVIDDFAQRRKQSTKIHEDALHATIQQALKRNLEPQDGPPKFPRASIRLSFRQFLGNVGSLIRNGIPFGQSYQVPSRSQVAGATEQVAVLDAEFTVLDPEKPAQKTETKDREKQS